MKLREGLPTHHGSGTSAPPVNRRSHLHSPSHTDTALGDISFAVAGPRLWNNLPVELRRQDRV